MSICKPGHRKPVGHGWKNKDGQLEIDWGYEKLAPDEILEFISCKCTKQCSVKKCCCIANKLPCTDLCNCKDCENSNVEFEGESDEMDFDEMDDLDN